MANYKPQFLQTWVPKAHGKCILWKILKKVHGFQKCLKQNKLIFELLSPWTLTGTLIHSNIWSTVTLLETVSPAPTWASSQVPQHRHRTVLSPRPPLGRAVFLPLGLGPQFPGPGTFIIHHAHTSLHFPFLYSTAQEILCLLSTFALALTCLQSFYNHISYNSFCNLNILLSFCHGCSNFYSSGRHQW